MFSESRLDLGINYGATFGPRFNTAIATQANGEESRRPLWSEPLIYAQLGEKVVNAEELEYLLDFHATVQGAYSGFRLRDWSDFYAEGQSLLAGPTNTYQLIKTYTVGAYSVVRPITKPVADTVKLYANGVEQLADWTIDTTTGVITTAIAGTLTVDFEFDVPVRFEQDQIGFRFEAGTSQRLFRLAPLNCTEIRLLPTVQPTLTAIPSEVAATISLGYDHRTTGGPQFNTLIATTASEFEDRIPLWATSLGSWEIGDRTLNREQLDYFLAWFRICRGQAIPFFFYDWQLAATKRVRFSEDRISVQFLAYRDHDQETIFSLGGIGLKETAIATCQPKTLNFSDPLTAEWGVVSALNTGIYAGATYDVDTSGGFWRTTLTYGDGISGYAAQIEWTDGWAYVPTHANEIIQITYNIDARFVSSNASGGSYPADLIIKQGSNSAILTADCGFNSNWATYTQSATLSFGDVGVPIYFTLLRRNSNSLNDFTARETIIDLKNIAVEVNVTCS